MAQMLMTSLGLSTLNNNNNINDKHAQFSFFFVIPCFLKSKISQSMHTQT